MVQEANSVSIIMVTYNSSSKLRTFFNKVLKSLSLQKHYLNGDVEMIAVDNNSKDNTPQTLRESRIFDKIIINHRNAGLPAGYSIGFSVFSGRYVFFMNDDVILLPNSLKKMIVETYAR